MEYTIMQLMEKANYNHEAKKSGWIYEWINNFNFSNQNIMTRELSNETLISLPPTEIYDNPTNEMKNQKQILEQALNKQMENQENYRRGMAA